MVFSPAVLLGAVGAGSGQQPGAQQGLAFVELAVDIVFLLSRMVD
jgi:hypothetical protein